MYDFPFSVYCIIYRFLKVIPIYDCHYVNQDRDIVATVIHCGQIKPAIAIKISNCNGTRTCPYDKVIGRSKRSTTSAKQDIDPAVFMLFAVTKSSLPSRLKSPVGHYLLPKLKNGHKIKNPIRIAPSKIQIVPSNAHC
jgi:hypothetical protein